MKFKSRPIILLLGYHLLYSPIASAQITNPTVTNDQTNIYLGFTENNPFIFYQAFIDSDMSPATGYQIKGIGADRLIENTFAYRSTASGTNWDWAEIQNVTFTNSKNVAAWTVPLSILGAPLTCNTPINIVYSANSPNGADDVTSVINYKLNVGSNCIFNTTATASSTQFNFQFAITSPQQFYRVYIDSDQNPATGYAENGIGADYLIENNSLYSYKGPGWNWTLIQTIPYTQTNNVNNWLVNRSIFPFNCSGAMNYVYQVQNTAIASSSPATLTYTGNSSCPLNTQKIAVPSYFYPDCATNPSCYFGQLDKGIPTVGLAVINPDSGPGTEIDPNYLAQTKTTQALGGIVLGYVHTSYGARAASAVESDINAFYAWYGVDGIFLDEGSTSCNTVSYYSALNTFIKQKAGKDVTVVNFGTNTPQCLANVADIMLTFEDTYNAYLTYQVDSWTKQYPNSHFWHVIYDTPQASLANAIALSKQRGAGYVYATPLTLPNPYNALPTLPYWNAEVSAVQGVN